MFCCVHTDHWSADTGYICDDDQEQEIEALSNELKKLVESPSNNSLAIAKSDILVCISTKNASKILLLYFIIISNICRVMRSCDQKIPH